MLRVLAQPSVIKGAVREMPKAPSSSLPQRVARSSARDFLVRRPALQPILRLKASRHYSVNRSDPRDTAAALVNRADDKAEDGDLTAALQAYDRALRLWPGYDLAHNNRACALSRLGRHEEALQSIDAALELDRIEPTVHVNRACILHSLGRYEEAAASAKRAIELQYDCGSAHSILGDVLASSGNYAEAIKSYELAERLNFKDPNHYLRKAELLGALGQFDLAIENYRLGIASKECAPETCSNLGLMLLDCKKVDEAIETLTTAIDHSGGTIPQAYFGRARAYDTIHKYDISIYDYEKAISSDKRLEYYWNFSACLMGLERKFEALSVLDEALEADPTNAITNHLKGMVLTSLGQSADAVDCYDIAIANGIEEALPELYPDAPGVGARNLHKFHGDSLYAVGRIEEAAVAFRRAIELGESTPTIYFKLVISLSNVGRIDEATAALHEGLYTDPQHPRFDFARAAIHFAKKEYGEALRLIQTYQRSTPSVAYDSYHFEAGILAGLGRFSDAVGAYERALKHYPDSIELKLGRAAALAGAGRRSVALAAYDEILAGDAQNIAARSGRADVLIAMGQVDQAVAELNETGRILLLKSSYVDAIVCFDKVLAASPGNGAALARKGFAVANLGRAEEGLALCDEAAKANPENPVVYLNRAQVMHLLGHNAQALENVDIARNLGADPKFCFFFRYPILLEIKRGEEALRDAEGLERIHPQNVSIVTAVGLIKSELGRHEEAIECFDRAESLSSESAEDLRTYRGISLIGLNKASEAVGELDAALAKDPENVLCHFHLGRALSRLSRYTEALEEFERALPEAIETQLERGKALAGLGRHEDACSAFSRVLEADPQNEGARRGRTNSLISLGRYVEARSDLAHLLGITANKTSDHPGLFAYNDNMIDEDSIIKFAEEHGIPKDNWDELKRTVQELLIPPLPAQIPDNIKYSNRANQPELRDMTPIEFLDKVWGYRINSGQFFQFQLGKLDQPLLQAVKNYCRQHKIAVSTVIPPKKEFVDRTAATVAGRPELRKSVAAAQRRRERAARQPKPK